MKNQLNDCNNHLFPLLFTLFSDKHIFYHDEKYAHASLEGVCFTWLVLKKWKKFGSMAR